MKNNNVNMENQLTYNKVWLYLFLFLIIFSLISHISGVLWMIQYNDGITAYEVFDVGFYYYIPVVLWICYTPIIFWLYKKWPLSGFDWKKNLFLHLLISLLFAPISRVIAITLDYSIKNLVGMESIPIFEILLQAKYIFFASAPKSFLFYWVIISAMIYWKHNQNRKKETPAPNNSDLLQQLPVPDKAGKKMLNVEDILWIEASRNYVNIHTAQESYKLRRSLASLSEVLNEYQFLQIHRSKIINKNAIDSLTHWRRGEYLITLKNNKLLTSSRTYHQNVKKLLTSI